MWFRVDNRMVHGQVIEAWLPYLQVKRLIVVNDAVAEDIYQQQIMQLAIPGRIKVSFVDLDSVKALFDQLSAAGEQALFVMKDCHDAKEVFAHGVSMGTLNVANMHYAPGKKQICPHVAASDEDLACLRFFKERHIDLDFRCVPGENPRVEDWS